MKRGLCLFLMVLAATGAMAASSEMPSSEEVQQEINRIAPERKALFDPDNPHTRSSRSPFPHVPTPPAAGLDPEALAQRFQHHVKLPSRDVLLFFVSFSVPEASLRRILSQAQRLDATVVFRGLKGGSLKESAAAIRAINPMGARVQIHPEAFIQYRINAVPATVLVHLQNDQPLDDAGCALPGSYVAIAGDVSADYALQEIARQSVSFKPAAERLLRDLGVNR